MVLCERWILWARSAVPGVILCASTTMMVESHWYLLKRHHLINGPRARLDRVVHVLLQDTVPHLLHKWRQTLILRRCLLPFEQEFLVHKFATANRKWVFDNVMLLHPGLKTTSIVCIKQNDRVSKAISKYKNRKKDASATQSECAQQGRIGS
jgi:hypothetical protein